MDISIESLKEYYEKIIHSIKRWRFGNKAQLAFLEDLYLLIDDGIPANRAIEMMSQVSTGLQREVAFSLANKISQGQPLADGMMEWFSLNVVEIIRVGESGGALPQTMKSAINMLSQKGIAMGALLNAIIYPLFVLIVACFVILYLDSSVFSQFRLIKPESEWPPAGQRLVWIGKIIKEGWWIFLLVVTAIIISFRIAMRYYVGEFRITLDRVPPFIFYKRLVAARVLETLGLLVANGVVFKSAIKVMQLQAEPYMLLHLQKMEHLLSKGKSNIADVLDTGLVSEDDLMRLRVMAEVKGFEHGLIRMGVRGAESATQTLKLISRILGGLFLICGCILIVCIVQGIYMTGMAMGQQ